MPRFDDPRPGAGLRFYKAHGLGNDYLVVPEGRAWETAPARVEALCHRTRGVGSDGLIVALDADGPPFPLRMFNPDGSEFERSGNGLRIAAAWLLGEGRVEVGRPFAVRVGGDEVEMVVHGEDAEGRTDVSVEMGSAGLGPGAVELDPDHLDPMGNCRHPDPGADGWLATDAIGPLPVHLISVGNPHCVVFAEALCPEDAGVDPFTDDVLGLMGPALTGHEAFRHGTNVQLARVVDEGVVAARIWERGVGRTSASGTSACAVAVAAVRSGRLDAGDVEVRMDGGVLQVRVGPAMEVTLRGPVEPVCRGEVDPGLVGSG